MLRARVLTAGVSAAAATLALNASPHRLTSSDCSPSFPKMARAQTEHESKLASESSTKNESNSSNYTSEPWQVVHVQVVFRHGARTPIEPWWPQNQAQNKQPVASDNQQQKLQHSSMPKFSVERPDMRSAHTLEDPTLIGVSGQKKVSSTETVTFDENPFVKNPRGMLTHGGCIQAARLGATLRARYAELMSAPRTGSTEAVVTASVEGDSASDRSNRRDMSRHAASSAADAVRLLGQVRARTSPAERAQDTLRYVLAGLSGGQTVKLNVVDVTDEASAPLFPVVAAPHVSTRQGPNPEDEEIVVRVVSHFWSDPILTLNMPDHPFKGDIEKLMNDIKRSNAYSRHRARRDELAAHVRRDLGVHDLVPERWAYLTLFDLMTTVQAEGYALPSFFTPHVRREAEHLAAEGWIALTYDHSDAMLQTSAGLLMLEMQDRLKEALEGSADHKVVLYSGHDTTLMPLLCALRVWEPGHWPRYTSNVAVELLRANPTQAAGNKSNAKDASSSQQTPSATQSQDLFVRVRYNDKVVSMQGLCPTSVRDGACPAADFFAHWSSMTSRAFEHRRASEGADAIASARL